MPLAAAILALSLQGPAVAMPAEPPRAPHVIQLAEGWDDLNEGQRNRALRNYEKYIQLPEEKRRSVDQRYEKWKRMPPSDRDRARRRHDEYRRERGLGFADD